MKQTDVVLCTCADHEGSNVSFCVPVDDEFYSVWSEHGTKTHLSFLQNEIFASRHQDVNSVACIEDKCYVLTLAQYCR